MVCEFGLIARQEVWPNFFIVGAVKAATTSLYYYLKEVPGVYMPPIKEPSYFSPNTVQGAGLLDIIRDREQYVDLYRNAAGHHAIGEASPTYLWDPQSPKLIHQAIPNARIIIVLRDPIDRAYSQYLERMKYSGMNLSFYDELMRDGHSDEKMYPISKFYVEFGMYSEQVRRYFDEFGIHKVKVIIFEEFIQHPEKTVNEILAFLGINFTVTKIKGRYNSYSSPRSRFSILPYVFFRWIRARNARIALLLLGMLPDSLTETLPERFLFKKSQKPLIQPEAVAFLRQTYSEDVMKLQSLLGRDLPWQTTFGKHKTKE